MLAQEVDLTGRVVGDPEGTDLARGGEVVERAGDLVRLDEGVGAVQQKDVDVVGPECCEGSLDGRDDVLVGEVEVPAVALLAASLLASS